MSDPQDEAARREAASIIDALLHGPADDEFDAGSAEADTAVAARLARAEQDAALREAVVDEALLHAGLRRSLRRRALSNWAVGRAERIAWRRLAAVAAVGMAAAVAVAVFWPRPFATVTAGGTTAVWRGGMRLRGEACELDRGVIGLTTRRGAQLVIEAPAAFHFESAQRLRMVRGRISADVPPAAKGFTVITPSGDAVDLGTRFAVDVPADGEPEVHVFEGEVVARGRSAAAGTSLRGGEAFSLAANAARELRTAAFIRGPEARELAAGLTEGRAAESRSLLDRLRRDPAAIAVIDFEHPPAGDAAAMTGGQYRLVQGRWPGSWAADFVRVGDHLPVDVGGGREWPQLTLAAWVRLDVIGAPYQSLYHTDGWERENPGQVHWMITEPGVMRLALRAMTLAAGSVERHGFPDSATSVLGAEGRWTHLAVVHDSDRKTVRFHLDGRFDSETRLAIAPPARLGPARIGNWNRNDRRLSGRIDDLVLLGRAASDEEIRAMHTQGNPYREAAR